MGGRGFYHGRFVYGGRTPVFRLYQQAFICSGGGTESDEDAAGADCTRHQYDIECDLLYENSDTYLYAGGRFRV